MYVSLIETKVLFSTNSCSCSVSFPCTCLSGCLMDWLTVREGMMFALNISQAELSHADGVQRVKWMSDLDRDSLPLPGHRNLEKCQLRPGSEKDWETKKEWEWSGHRKSMKKSRVKSFPRTHLTRVPWKLPCPPSIYPSRIIQMPLLLWRLPWLLQSSEIFFFLFQLL